MTESELDYPGVKTALLSHFQLAESLKNLSKSEFSVLSGLSPKMTAYNNYLFICLYRATVISPPRNTVDLSLSKVSKQKKFSPKNGLSPIFRENFSV